MPLAGAIYKQACFKLNNFIVWSILIENTWFCPVGTVITLFYHVHFENKESSASRSSSLVDALTLSKRERGRKERNISNGICQCDYWKIFELICTYLHFTGTSSVPTYQRISKFFKIYPLYVISTEYFDPCNYQTRTDESLILFCTGRTYHQSFRVWNKKFDLYESTTRCLRCFLASQARIQF